MNYSSISAISQILIIILNKMFDGFCFFSEASPGCRNGTPILVDWGDSSCFRGFIFFGFPSLFAL